MLEYTITEDNGMKEIILKGRIDSVSSKDLEFPFKELTGSGERKIIVNFEEVGYVSSAGLRVFLIYQKELKKVNGELIMYKMNDNILNVFKMSGFDRLFRFIDKKEDITLVFPISSFIRKEIDGISLEIKEQTGKTGTLFPTGSEKYLSGSQYIKDHVLSLKPEDIKFGTGLTAIGEDFDEYKKYFGESLIINSSLFVYPAVKRPSVDFMIHSGQDMDIKYNFLHGFGFNGDYRYILSMEDNNNFIELQRFIDTLFQITEANLIGIIFLAESKGMWGMNLKQIPLLENKPSGNDIFNHNIFSEWMNFSIEADDIDKIVMGCGIAVKDKDKEKQEIKELMPQGNNFHIHSCIFEQSLLNKDIINFDKEIKRVMTELEPLSIKHLLNKTRFKRIVAGLIELKG
jgi:anti-anti-sigma factor